VNPIEPHFYEKAPTTTLPAECISGDMGQESPRELEDFEGDSFRVSGSYNNTINITPMMDVRGLLFQWLSPSEPRQRHKELQSSRLDGVGNRFLETVEFRKWSGGGGGDDPAVLFCCGDLGTGKSYLK